MTKRYVNIGEPFTHEMPFSEVCMSMGIAGKRMQVMVLPTGMAQLYTASGARFSFPVTLGEAGIYSDNLGRYVEV